MEKEIGIEKNNLLTAYRQANGEGKQLLRNLFGKEIFNPQDVTERIKTFRDAMSELGRAHILVREWASTNPLTSDLDAYMKLRIIVAALNEGWKPRYTKDEQRWYPWFRLYTAEELQSESDEWKRDHCLRILGEKSSDYTHFAFADTYKTPLNMPAPFSSCLCLKSKALADYCGRQFMDLWRDLYTAG